MPQTRHSPYDLPICFLFNEFQNLTVLSALPETNLVPSGENMTDKTLPVCYFRGPNKTSPLSTSQTIISRAQPIGFCLDTECNRRIKRRQIECNRRNHGKWVAFLRLKVCRLQGCINPESVPRGSWRWCSCQSQLFHEATICSVLSLIAMSP